ncbi:hypothetical protein GCM10018954_031520 [Kutzneria kofuensis]
MTPVCAIAVPDIAKAVAAIAAAASRDVIFTGTSTQGVGVSAPLRGASRT